MATVEFNHITKQFDQGTVALKNFSLQINDGEFMVLVGPSGCGKSTALRLLAGLESITQGEIKIDQQVVNELTPQKRNIAMVFQNYALYPHMNVRNNLAFPLRMEHLPRQTIEEKVHHIANILDLTDLLNRKPAQLSGGQRQRVAMGRALVRDPSVFLLDEPLSNLDAKLRAQIRADIAKLQRQLNKTTLYVTHDQVEAMTLGDRVAVMNAGQLQQVGTPEALYQRPQNTFVAKFIGSPGMNILPARLMRTKNNGYHVHFPGQTITLPTTTQEADSLLIPYINQAVLVGIRPEAFRVAPDYQCTGLNVHIQSVEYLGHESLLYLNWPEVKTKTGEETIIARLPGTWHEQQKAQTLYIDPADVYLFTPQGQYLFSSSI